MTFFEIAKGAILHVLAHGLLKKNLAAHDFNRVSAHTYVNYPVIALRGADENPAGPLHHYALLKEDPLVGFSHAVRHHPGPGTNR